MNDMFISQLILVSLLLINSLAFVYAQRLSKTGYFFGVFVVFSEIPQEAADQLHATERTFRRQTWLISGLILLGALGLVQSSITDVEAMLFTALNVQIISLSVIYVLTHKKVNALKISVSSSSSDTARASDKRTIDLELLMRKLKWKKWFEFLYFIPFGATIAIIVYLALHYSDLPDTLPTHWNLTGEADQWEAKSLFNVFGPIGIIIVIIVTFYLIGQSIFTTRSKQALQYLIGIATSLYLICWSVVAMIALISVTLITGSDFPSAWLFAILPLVVIPLIVLLIIQVKRNHNHDDVNPDDDDRYWTWGAFYNNPNDPAFMVEKRFGGGWTLNLSNRKAQLLLLLLSLIPIVLGIVFILA
jgi:uncharacterized membrane protein